MFVCVHVGMWISFQCIISVDLFYLFGISFSLCVHYDAAACSERSHSLNSKHWSFSSPNSPTLMSSSSSPNLLRSLFSAISSFTLISWIHSKIGAPLSRNRYVCDSLGLRSVLSSCRSKSFSWQLTFVQYLVFSYNISPPVASFIL